MYRRHLTYPHLVHLLFYYIQKDVDLRLLEMYETWHFLYTPKISLFPTGKNKRNEEKNKTEDLRFYKKQSPRGVQRKTCS